MIQAINKIAGSITLRFDQAKFSEKNVALNCRIYAKSRVYPAKSYLEYTGRTNTAMIYGVVICDWRVAGPMTREVAPGVERSSDAIHEHEAVDARTLRRLRVLRSVETTHEQQNPVSRDSLLIYLHISIHTSCNPTRLAV